MFLNRTIKLQSHLSEECRNIQVRCDVSNESNTKGPIIQYNNTRRKARRLHWAAIKPGLYRNIVLHDNDKLTRTDSDHVIKGNNPLNPSRSTGLIQPRL